MTKNQIGGRRFGSSLILKDNLCFGVKENTETVNEKAPLQDTILNMDTKKTIDNRCEFWVEFENGVRMTAEMLDVPEVSTERIPNADKYVAR